MAHKHLVGISSYSYPYACKGFPGSSVFSAEDLIDKAEELGVGCVQYGDNMPLEHLDDEQLAGLRRRAGSKGIVIEAGMRHASAERLTRYIHIAELLGAHLLRVIIDDREGAFEPDVDQVLTIINDALPLLEEKGIILGIENHDRFTVDEYAALVKKAGSRYVGMVVDTTNSLSTEESCENVLENLGPYCVCLHIKDYRISRIPGGLGLMITGACLGEGRMDAKTAVETAGKLSDRDFNVILESWMQPCETMEETLKQEAAWAAAGVEELKKLV